MIPVHPVWLHIIWSLVVTYFQYVQNLAGVIMNHSFTTLTSFLIVSSGKVLLFTPSLLACTLTLLAQQLSEDDDTILPVLALNVTGVWVELLGHWAGVIVPLG